MPRTTATLVRGIIQLPKKLTDADILPFITSANELVTELCASVIVPSTGFPYLTDTRLELIERWLSAHFAAIEYRRTIQQGVSSVQSTFEGKVDLLLNVTEYGQKAITLDTTGSLARYNNTLLSAKGSLPASGKRQTVAWLGKPPCDW